MYLQVGLQAENKIAVFLKTVRFWAQAVPLWDPKGIMKYRPGEKGVIHFQTTNEWF